MSGEREIGDMYQNIGHTMIPRYNVCCYEEYREIDVVVENVTYLSAIWSWRLKY